MRTFLVTLVVLVPFLASAQGLFDVFNPLARTHVGSLLGPQAGPGYWGQMLVGSTPDSLTPVGMALEHRANGTISGGIVAVPGIDGGMQAFVQMWAWNGTLWGTSLNGVPPDQFGKTDIVPIFLVFSIDPAASPRSTSPPSSPFPNRPRWRWRLSARACSGSPRAPAAANQPASVQKAFGKKTSLPCRWVI